MTLGSGIRSWLRAVVPLSRTKSEMDVELRFHIEAFAGIWCAAACHTNKPRDAGASSLAAANVRKRSVARAWRQLHPQHPPGFALRFAHAWKESRAYFPRGFDNLARDCRKCDCISIVDALFLSSVPAKNPERLVRILAPENDGEGYFSIPEFAYLRAQSKTVEDLTAHYSTAPLYISANAEIGEVQGAVVSSNNLPMLGLQPFLGRFFTGQEDSVADHEAVAVLRYGLGQRIYSGKSNVLGKTFLINGHTFTIVGHYAARLPRRRDRRHALKKPRLLPRVSKQTGHRLCEQFAAR